MGKPHFLLLVVLLSVISACHKKEDESGVYRLYSEKRAGFDVWVVDGALVRQKIYPEFLYGGNEQRYIFTPKGEIWIDNALSCEEYELTLVHELNERHLMAKFGWTYDRSHDSSLAIEVIYRHRYDSLSRQHESAIGKVSPTDWSGKKEIANLPDSIELRNIYRIPVKDTNGISIWIVDGYLVRKNIFPDFGFSGNDLNYHFIPKNEIWIDGQISCEETAYSITGELIERAMMAKGVPFGEAYEDGVSEISKQRLEMKSLIGKHRVIPVPDTLARDAGVIDPRE